MTTTTVRPERVTAQVRWYTPCPQPNGLQAVEEGMWVIDQKDHPLRALLLDWQDGHELRSFPTETNHSSGITWDGEHVWVASTYPPIELFEYSVNGKELRRLPTPGATERNGAHGLEWIDGKLWVTVPPSATTYQLDPRDGRVLKQFPAPGKRPHAQRCVRQHGRETPRALARGSQAQELHASGVSPRYTGTGRGMGMKSPRSERKCADAHWKGAGGTSGGAVSGEPRHVRRSAGDE